VAYGAKKWIENYVAPNLGIPAPLR
jgi:hypothetical protein